MLLGAGCQSASVESARPVPTEVSIQAPSPPISSAEPVESLGAAAIPRPLPAVSAAASPADVAELVEPLRRALVARDTAYLASLAHPEKGVRFEPYPYLDDHPHVVLTATEIAAGLTDPTQRDWGSYDGSGDPILLRFAAYFDRFVQIPEASTAQVSVDRILGSGNTVNNIREVYPAATILELHHPGRDPDLGGMDWASVRFVFERVPIAADGPTPSSSLKLVAIVHDEWTI